MAEGEEEQRAAGQFEDAGGESAEVRSLLGRVSLTDYLTPAGAGLGLSGAAAELNAALEVPIVGGGGGVAVPWRMLAGPERREQRPEGMERRAFTDTGDYAGGITARPILQRLFGTDIMQSLGVRMDSVPAGRSEWPLITNGVAPVTKAEGAAADAAVSATFSTETLKPKRLTGKYEYTHEQAAQVPGIEEALRRDLADAVRAKMSDLILNGDEATNAHEPDGFLTTLARDANNPPAVAAFADFAGLAGRGVDGIHAGREGEVAVVVGIETFQLATRVYPSTGSESGSEALTRRAAMFAGSSFIPDAPAAGANQDVQDGNILHAAGPNGGGADMRGDSVAAMWPTLEIVRDIYSQASQGVVLTWIALWDAQTAFRTGAYTRFSIKVR